MAAAGRPLTLNGITKAAWTNDETQTSFVIIFKLSHRIVAAAALSLLHSGMAIDILSSDRADRCRSNFGSLILHECRSKSDFDQHLARLPKQLFLVYNAELRRTAGMEDRMASAMRTRRELIDTNRY